MWYHTQATSATTPADNIMLGYAMLCEVFVWTKILYKCLIVCHSAAGISNVFVIALLSVVSALIILEPSMINGGRICLAHIVNTCWEIIWRNIDLHAHVASCQDLVTAILLSAPCTPVVRMPHLVAQDRWGHQEFKHPNPVPKRSLSSPEFNFGKRTRVRGTCYCNIWRSVYNDSSCSFQSIRDECRLEYTESAKWGTSSLDFRAYILSVSFSLFLWIEFCISLIR